MSNANVIERGPGEMMGNAGPGMLAGLRVIEVADERAEYTGLLLAGLGAEVVKVEPPEGNATRRIGPFLDDEPGLERSLFFWNYNRNKKSVVLDLRETMAREHMLRLLEGADILLDASCGALNEALRLDRAAMNARFPSLVTARMTPFGDDGPWKDFKSSDLVHLALGGVMMNCGYDPDPTVAIRYAADRAADLACLSYRWRATGHGHHRRDDPSAPHGAGAGRFGGGA